MQYKATTPIQHDGIRYEEGDALDLSDQEAAQLLEHGAVTPVDTTYTKKIDTTWGGSL